MTSTARYDAVIIGAGQAGVPLARSLAEAGWRTALVEREHVGGTCINEGCTPTKTMIASARVAYLGRRAADYGVATGAVSVDMRAVRQRKRDLVESWRAGSERRLRAIDGLDLVMAEAGFRGAARARDQATRRRRVRHPGRARLHQHRHPSLGSRHCRTRASALLHIDHHHGTRRDPRTPADPRRRLRRGGVRPDVPALREQRDHRPEG